MSSIDMVEALAAKAKQSMPKIIFASAAGTMVEWYDFYIFGSLASVIASKFYKTGTPLGDIIAWLAAFAVGFLVRPFGAIVFGRVGDLIGRKYTFLVTMTLMGLCTFAVGLLPTRDQIGDLAGIILIGLHRSRFGAGRRVRRRGDLHRRTFAAWQAWFLHQLHSDHGHAGPIRFVGCHPDDAHRRR
jgi:MFS family permease